ncbi:MAG: hypothetical protein QOI48_275, partial [Solirubrobacteraceae bacterium]|nr:hypothetical protein [Solirubrobacteraceae bacterium]
RCRGRRAACTSWSSWATRYGGPAMGASRILIDQPRTVPSAPGGPGEVGVARHLATGEGVRKRPATSSRLRRPRSPDSPASACRTPTSARDCSSVSTRSPTTAQGVQQARHHFAQTSSTWCCPKAASGRRRDQQHKSRHSPTANRVDLRGASLRACRRAHRWTGRPRPCNRRGLACSSGSRRRDRSVG